jgi:MGT family glycosyltransferase
MSRILAYTAPAHGQLFPLVPVLEELRARGHEVVLRTLAGEVERMRSLGLEAAPLAAEVEALTMDDWRARTAGGSMRRAAGVFAARAAADARDLERAIASERPDALLVDAAAWGALSAAEAWGGPWAAACPFPLPLSSVAAPPMGPGLRPARGAAGRLRDRALRPLIWRGFDSKVLPALGPLRTERGLPPFAHAEEIFRAPPLLLYMTAEPFEYARPDWPRNVVMVGPCSWEPPGVAAAELGAIAEPLVLVNTSTEFQDDARLVRVAFEALAGEPVHVVATLPAADATELPAPSNATVLGFSPHLPILARAACAITPGGMGATQKALGQGVPVCAVPFGRDQYEVARRVEVAGAGTRLPAPRLRPGSLRAKVREAIACRPGAERVARGFAEAGGAEAAADAFERL